MHFADIWRSKFLAHGIFKKYFFVHADLQWYLVHACKYVGLVICELRFEESVYDTECVCVLMGVWGMCLTVICNIFLLCRFVLQWPAYRQCPAVTVLINYYYYYFYDYYYYINWIIIII